MNEPLVIQTDGGSRGNPGLSACAYWIPRYQDGMSKYLGKKTNNEAEYEGVILALQYALKFEAPNIHIKSDSKLIVNQILGVWQTKFEHLQELRAIVTTLAANLNSFEISYIPRAQNAEADRLGNLCMDRHHDEYQKRYAA